MHRFHSPRFAALLLLIASAAGTACSAEPEKDRAPAGGPTAAATRQIMSAVEPEVERLMTDPGYRAVSGVVYFRGRAQTFHFGVLPSGHRPDDRTLYEVASITKTYTGLLLAQAVRDGKVELDVPVSAYLPEIDPARLARDGQDVTLRHLATHTSGLPVFLTCDEGDMPDPARIACLEAHDDRDFLTRLARADLLSEPGRTYLYSSVGSRLIGLVLERRYGASYEDLLQRFVFARTGETDVHCRIGPQDQARLATPEGIGPGCNGGSGLIASTADIARYLAFYLSGGNDLVVQATTPLVQQGQWGRAYQWNTYRPDTEGMLYHGGGAFNTSSWVSIYPREGMGVFLTTPHVASDAQEELNERANAIVARLRRLPE
ncbi:serine hydrolase domain-containing protein [Brevundimonas faecalis]|uniref:serine hydrolase domain-containing protein n=1 Tax=Brevundimonas faecalis TaxID=947378 RepID=UPI003622C132